MLDHHDLELSIFISHNLTQDCIALYESPFVSQDAEFDFGTVHFEPQVYAQEIENSSL